MARFARFILQLAASTFLLVPFHATKIPPGLLLFLALATLGSLIDNQAEAMHISHAVSFPNVVTPQLLT